MKKLLSILLVAVLCFSCVSCGNIGKTIENSVVDYLSDYLESFKDPASVSVVTATMNTKDGNFVTLKISAKNSYGAAVTSEYILVLNTFSTDGETFKEGTIVNKDDTDNIDTLYIIKENAAEALDRYKSFDDFGKIENIELDVSYINKKLEKYKKSNGLI